jgi:hypothetical protein
MDRGHVLAPGIFRSLKRGERKKSKLDVSYKFGDNEILRFIGFEPLGADDLRLLQGLVSLGGPHGILLKTEPKSEITRQLRLFLDTKLDAATKDALVVKETLYKLLSEIGLTNTGDNIKALKASLLRMANVTVLVTSGNREASFHLMSYAIDKDDGKILVALNPRLTDAILGNRAYAYVGMAEVRELQTDPARLIHQRLCAWIDQGKSGHVELDTLCGYVWPDESKNPNTIKTRRQIARKALAELTALEGWTVDEYAKGKWEIKRPGRKHELTPPKTQSTS